jgi:hypothetical protein
MGEVKKFVIGNFVIRNFVIGNFASRNLVIRNFIRVPYKEGLLKMQNKEQSIFSGC